jgi:hypothetical protein
VRSNKIIEDGEAEHAQNEDSVPTPDHVAETVFEGYHASE